MERDPALFVLPYPSLLVSWSFSPLDKLTSES
jgi:hypothetical protein